MPNASNKISTKIDIFFFFLVGHIFVATGPFEIFFASRAGQTRTAVLIERRTDGNNLYN